jgi:hypothetical protein
MKRDLLFVAIVSIGAATGAASAGCYNPQLGRCTVRCQGEEACPDNLTCASDNFCHTANDPPNCNSSGGDGGMGSDDVTLTVMPTGSGTGTVTSTSPVIACNTNDAGGPTCKTTVEVGTVVTLTAAADASSIFDTWGDAASSCSNQICMITVHGATTVTAQFDAAAQLTIDVTGNGDGVVTSSPVGLTLAGMTCSDENTPNSVTCTGTFAIGANISLTATPNNGDGSVFGDWQQESDPLPCADPTNPTCPFTLDGDLEFGVQFN